MRLVTANHSRWATFPTSHSHSAVGMPVAASVSISRTTIGGLPDLSQTLSPTDMSSAIGERPSGDVRFPRGTTVYLKSGGPPMTTGGTKTLTMVTVFWTDDSGKRQMHSFPEACLVDELPD